MVFARSPAGQETEAVLEQAAKRDVRYSDFLDELLTLEVQSKTAKYLSMRVAMARFPFQKTIDAFWSVTRLQRRLVTGMTKMEIKVNINDVKVPPLSC